MPSLVRGLSITFITLFGFVAMAGTVGAGGIGDIAIRYGYQRYQDDVMVVAIVLCVIIVQIAQSICSAIARKIDHRVRLIIFSSIVSPGHMLALFVHPYCVHFL